MILSKAIRNLPSKVRGSVIGSGNGRRLVNIAHLLTGSFAGSLLGLIAFALCARSLGVAEYGQLALMLAYTRVIERIASFQSWQPIIKYGAGLSTAEQREDLRKLLKFGLLMDMSSALCAWLIAISGAYLAAPYLGWTEDSVHVLVLFSTVLLFQIPSMPTAVQRLAGRFSLLAYGQLGTALLRVALCFVGLMNDAGLGYFAFVWACTQILGNMTLLGFALRTLRRQGVRNILGAPLAGLRQKFPGIWGFAWSSNLSLTIQSSSQELDTLLVSLLTDPASAGLYHISKRIGRMAQQVGGLVQSVIYPDVSRLWAAGKIKEFKRLVLQVELLLLTAGVAAVVFMAVSVDRLLLWTAGPQFLPAANLVVVQMFAVALALSGSAARVALLAMGRPRDVLVVVVTATVIFQVTAVLLLPQIGPMGANIAHIVMGTVWMIGLGWHLHRALRASQRERAEKTEPADYPLLAPESA